MVVETILLLQWVDCHRTLSVTRAEGKENVQVDYFEMAFARPRVVVCLQLIMRVWNVNDGSDGNHGQCQVEPFLQLAKSTWQRQ